MNQQSNYQKVIKRFFRPLIKHPYRTVIASAIIGIMLFIVVDIGLAELVRQNTYDINILTLEELNEHGPDLDCEQISESGPGYVEIGQQHMAFIRELREQSRQRKFATILRVLYPEYSLEKALEKAGKELDIAIKAGDEEITKGIYQIGLSNNRHYLLAKKFPRSPVEWFKSEDLPDMTLTALDEQLDAFSKDVNNIDIRTLPTAVAGCRKACIDSRKIILTLFRARFSYNNKEKIQDFLNDLIRVRDISQICAQKREYASKRELFEGRYKNMDIRSRILVPLLAGDMHRVCEIINKEKAPLLAKKM